MSAKTSQLFELDDAEYRQVAVAALMSDMEVDEFMRAAVMSVANRWKIEGPQGNPFESQPPKPKKRRGRPPKQSKPDPVYPVPPPTTYRMGPEDDGYQ